MPILEGNAAPSFALPCKPGEIIDVGASIGRKPVVLLFFPLAFSSVCTEEMCEMRDEWSAWSTLPADVFGVTVDSPFVTAKFREELRLPFPVLSDFNREAASKYDVVHEELAGLKRVPRRSVFVIGKDGKVAYRWVTDDPRVKPDFAAVRAALARAGG